MGKIFKTQSLIKTMNKIIKILLGLILLVIPLYLILPGMPLESWGIAALDLIKGGITILILILGIILIILGLDELRK